MNNEDFKTIFSEFCDSWHFNSFSVYNRNLMFQLNDFHSIAKHLELPPEEAVHLYRVQCEKNRLDLMRKFDKHKINWRNLEFVKFEPSDMELHPKYQFPFEVTAWGDVLLTDQITKFKILDCIVFKAQNGYVLNVDTCKNEIIQIV
jgi:hypothetical protein